ncbi:MAG: ribonuclease HII [Verrucomicrobiia bacterium]
MLRYERRAYQNGAKLVAGIDEAGRGPLAGPVMAAAVVLPREFHHNTLTDSKLLTARQRDCLFAELTANPDVFWAVGVSSVEVIDRDNILRATEQAMLAAFNALPCRPDHALIDGWPVRGFPVAQTAIVGGDGKSFSIAAASVIAKVTRDRLMTQLHEQFPQYNFARHKGYGTPEHLAALEQHGPSPVHRQSFAPVRHALELVQKSSE